MCGSVMTDTDRRSSVLTAWIPSLLTSFVGREGETAQLQHVLKSGEVRLVTLTGPAGIGKTRLALETMAAVRSTFPQGAGFVQLAPLKDPSLLAITVADDLNIPVIDVATAESRLLSFLREARALLLLDNAEHLVEEVARFVEPSSRMRAFSPYWSPAGSR